MEIGFLWISWEEQRNFKFKTDIFIFSLNDSCVSQSPLLASPWLLTEDASALVSFSGIVDFGDTQCFGQKAATSHPAIWFN